MLIITLRTDKPEAEIGLYDGQNQLIYTSWYAHRELAETLNTKVAALLKQYDKKLQDISGVVVFKGPGSFTGLRIGISVANTLAYSLGIPVVSSGDPKWLESGIQRLQTGENQQIALPEYGAEPHITQQKR